MAWYRQQRSKQLSVECNYEDAINALKSEFLREFQHANIKVHRLIDALTAISGYAQLVKLNPERSVDELPKIMHTVEKCMQMLRGCILNLKELERKYS